MYLNAYHNFYFDYCWLPGIWSHPWHPPPPPPPPQLQPRPAEWHHDRSAQCECPAGFLFPFVTGGTLPQYVHLQLRDSHKDWSRIISNCNNLTVRSHQLCCSFFSWQSYQWVFQGAWILARGCAQGHCGWGRLRCTSSVHRTFLCQMRHLHSAFVEHDPCSTGIDPPACTFVYAKHCIWTLEDNI